MKTIKRWYKQLMCDHRWVKKSECLDTLGYTWEEFRCPKCKKIKQSIWWK